MLLIPPALTRRLPVLALVGALLTLLLVVAGAVLPTPSARAATVAPGSVSVAFVNAGVWGGNLRSTYALTSKPVSAQFYVQKSWRSAGGRTAPVTATVERRPAGGSWRATGQRVSTRTAKFHVALPATSTSSTAGNATVSFRLRVSRGGVVAAPALSSAITVHARNPLRFTGLTKFLHDAVHERCPSAVVRVVHFDGDTAGDFTTGQYALRIDASIGRYRAVDRRAVVLHECGHYLQWRNYGATSDGWARMTRDAKALFGTNVGDPVEHMADCIAQKANPGGYMGYGGRCTDVELAAATRMLDGKRAR